MELGFPFFLFRFRLEDGPEPAQLILTNFSPEWVAHYRQQEYTHVDPHVATALRTVEPFAWEELKVETPRQRQFVAEAKARGLEHGFTVPMHGPQGRIFSSFSCAGRVLPPRGEARDRLYSQALYFTTQMFKFLENELARLPRVDERDRVRLSPRQREVLEFIAQGLPPKKIGDLLGISLETVRKHLKLVLAKYQTNSREAAIVRAWAGRQIVLIAYPPGLDGNIIDLDDRDPLQSDL